LISGSKFLCSEVIAPVKSEVDDICLYIINFEDLTSPPSPVEQPDPASRLSKCNDYKRFVLRGVYARFDVFSVRVYLFVFWRVQRPIAFILS
jgi:hypothetical protein